jgi:hypothetical protein
MNKVWAVALLDFRRLGFGLLSGALIAGLTPALASGLGVKVPLEVMLALALGLTGLAAGGYFGNDFAEGRGSFYFARPLPVIALIGGRITSLLGLAAAAFGAFMASSWLARNELSDWSFSVVNWSHLQVLAATWSVSLYASLAIAASGRNRQREWKWRDALTVPVRLVLILGGVLAIFGLFADLMVRAYASPGPMKLMFFSWIVAAAMASGVAIAAGRTEGMRIARFQHIVMFSHLALVAVVVVSAWTYVLNPGPAAIQIVTHVMSSPDGSTAWAATTVDRGQATQYHPIFTIDLASGQVAHLKSDPDQGPWLSADGQTTVWSAASPIFFRPIKALFGEASTFRVRGPAGNVEPLPMPVRLGPGFRGRGLADFVSDIYSVLPSQGGDAFAVLGRGLTVISRSGEDRGEVDFGKEKSRIQGMVFAPTGALRVALGRTQATPPSIEFVDVDPRTLKVTSLGSVPAGFVARVQFNRSGTQALLTVSGDRFTDVAVSLLDLDTRPIPSLKLLVPQGPQSRSVFLADGRIVTLAGARDQAVLRIFTATGEPALELPMGEGHAMLSGEMFPGIVAVHTGKYIPMDLALIDSATGAVVRRVPSMNSPLVNHQYPRQPPAPLPGTPGARLLTSQGKLYELPSLTAEPRLLLPLL